MAERMMISSYSAADTDTGYGPAVLSGGGWASTLPLSNLQDRRVYKKARSTGITEALTTFNADLGTAASISVAALCGHNFTRYGLVRWRAWSALPIADYLPIDPAVWTLVATPTRSAAAAFATDGTPLDLLGDDNAAALEGHTVVAPFTGNATKLISIKVSKGTATSSVIRVRDTSAGANRLLAAITWVGSVPSVAMTTGTLVSSTLIETVPGAVGVLITYRITFLTTSVTAANTNQIELYPATDAALAVANTGNVYWGDVTAHDQTADVLLADTGYRCTWWTGWRHDDPATYPTATPQDWPPNASIFVWPSTGVISARYWRCNIRDTAHPSGYVEIGRLWLGYAFSPAVDASYGIESGWEDDSERAVSNGGAAHYWQGRKRRTLRGAFGHLTQAEAFSDLTFLSKLNGVSRQCFVVPFPDDRLTISVGVYDNGVIVAARSMLAVARRPGVLRHPHLNTYEYPFEFIEEI